MTGNEVPEDVSRAITTSLERNRERHIHEIHSKSHSETLAHTLQTLSVSHHDALEKLSGKLASSSNRAQTLSEKLETASDEISRTQNALRHAQARVEILTNEKHEFEAAIIKERSATQEQITELQTNLVKEREVTQ